MFRVKVTLENISKKFSAHWVIRDFSHVFEEGGSYALLGSNGSGKSTLMQIVSGFLSPVSGKVIYESGSVPVKRENVHRYLSLAAPWSDPADDLTLQELLEFHIKFRPLLPGISVAEALRISGLEHAKDRLIRNYSSGMKQRVRLLLAVLSQSSALLLDEPSSNLDAAGIEWYRALLRSYGLDRLVIVASNHQLPEYDFCRHAIELRGT